MSTMARRLLSAWLALAVSSKSLSCTDGLSVRQFGRHQAGRIGNSHGLRRCRLSMSNAPSSSSSQTSAWSKLTVPQLKSQLKELNLPVSGVKAQLIQRLEEHEASLSTAEEPSNEPKGEQQQRIQSPTRKRSISFPPPKDETEVQVLEKEVHETVQLLDSLKLGNGQRQQSPSSSSTVPSRQLSRQKKQEKELMESLKQSLRQSQQGNESNGRQTPSLPSEQSAHSEKMQHYVEQLRLRPANDLKEELNNLRLSSKGRKPDLVQRLAEYYVSRDANRYDEADDDDNDGEDFEIPSLARSSSLDIDRPVSFAGIPRLSANAANALHQAFGETTDADPEPTPIQSVAVPRLYYPPQPSALLHAPTGSGKTIAYLLPITETLWKEVENAEEDGMDVNDMGNGVALVLLPTRELAAQVAGVATVLAPPGMVKLVPRPMDLMNLWKEEADRGEDFEYHEKEGTDAGIGEETGRKYRPRILVGSAKSVSTSLFGDKKMPGTPTSKPQGKELLSNVRWLVMDEVDRLLNVKKSRTDKKSRRHEKPAALLSAAVSRLTLGKVQVIAASATVGRPLRRELSRVLGLHSAECPETLRGEEDSAKLQKRAESDEKHVGRAVRIPDTVRNYVLPVDGSTSGSLLTSAAFASKAILQQKDNFFDVSNRRVLLVITRGCDIKVHDALGALRHFGVRPEPKSLLDALEADGSDRLVEAHRKVSGVEGVGGSKSGMDGDEDEGYLLVTHEDNVRGLHLDGLDAVIVVGRPGSPDEYTHIAGRTGRAGRKGSVLNIVSFEQAAALASWTKMLGIDFLPVDESEVAGVVDD